MKFFKQLFLFGLTFILIIVFCEFFIRISYLASVYPNDFYKDIGKGRRRNLNYVYFNEGFGVGKFNEYRYIGESNPYKKGKNTVRIALLGDSYVEALQVFQRDYFGNIAQKLLEKKNTHIQFEVLNFGQSGFDIGDMYAYQKIFVERFSPDYIYYFISYEDDGLEPFYVDPLRPKTIIKNDSLEISYRFSPSTLSFFQKTKGFVQYSAVLNMFRNSLYIAQNKSVKAIFLDKIYFWFNPITKKVKSDEEIEFEMNPVTERIISNLNSEMVVFVNRDMQKLPSEFESIISQKGFRYLDLSIPLNAMKEGGLDPKYWKISKKRFHWNQKAHLLIGAELSNFINDTIIIE